ncbi:hypothetical protein Avbf_12831 [Armadillidium vulgare]|nr:hypothetical protein Avbf_12831 [Armadillidium vulgare]
METNNYTNRTISPTSSFSINNADVVKENGWMEKLKGKLLYFSKRKSVVKDSSELAHIYLHSYYGNYSNILVKNQWALVDLYDQTLENNKAYKKYYKKLVKIQDLEHNEEHWFYGQIILCCRLQVKLLLFSRVFTLLFVPK